MCRSPAWADASGPCLPGAGPAWANRLARFGLAPGACPVGQRSGVQVGSLWSPTFPLDLGAVRPPGMVLELGNSSPQMLIHLTVLLCGGRTPDSSSSL